MNTPYIEITYRHGKPFAAYLYLDRKPGDKSVRTERHGAWLIDFASDGRAIGVEFLEVGAVDLSALNQSLAKVRQSAVSIADLAPLSAA